VCENLESPDTQYKKTQISTKLLKKDSLFDQSNGFIVVDGNYISSRWSGDSYTFIFKFIELLNQMKEKDDIIVEEKQDIENNPDDIFS